MGTKPVGVAPIDRQRSPKKDLAKQVAIPEFFTDAACATAGLAGAWDASIHGETDEDRAERQCEAISVCKRCPIAEQCYQFALENVECKGIWGGVLFVKNRQNRAAASA